MDRFDEAIIDEIEKFLEIYSNKGSSKKDIDDAYQKISKNLVKKKGIFKYVSRNDFENFQNFPKM